MRFTKMQGCGNDFVILEESEIRSRRERRSELVKSLCDRRFGIGADGVLVLKAGAQELFEMEVYNADGSQAEICGNGLRCATGWLWTKGLVKERRFRIACSGAVKTVEVLEDAGAVISCGETLMPADQARQSLMIRAEMGAAVFSGAATKRSRSGQGEDDLMEEAERIVLGWKVHCVSMGNPHAVVLLQEDEDWPVEEAGPRISRAEEFPGGTNVEFVKVLGRGRIAMRVWERGVGETLACGSGACAAAAVCMQKGLTDEKITVTLLGGTLLVSREGPSGSIFMTGPAAVTFEGEIFP